MKIDLENMLTEQGDTILYLSVKSDQLDAAKYLLEKHNMKRPVTLATMETPYSILQPWRSSLT